MRMVGHAHYGTRRSPRANSTERPELPRRRAERTSVSAKTCGDPTERFFGAPVPPRLARRPGRGGPQRDSLSPSVGAKPRQAAQTGSVVLRCACASWRRHGAPGPARCKRSSPWAGGGRRGKTLRPNRALVLTVRLCRATPGTAPRSTTPGR
jgi:hypothetical protein